LHAHDAGTDGRLRMFFFCSARSTVLAGEQIYEPPRAPIPVLPPHARALLCCATGATRGDASDDAFMFVGDQIATSLIHSCFTPSPYRITKNISWIDPAVNGAGAAQ